MGTTKKRYIELYGEEAWELEKVRRREYYKKYYIENHDRLLKKQKNYFETHREENKNRCKRNYEANKEERLDYARQYSAEHKDEKAVYSKKYASDHKIEISEYQKDYRKQYLDTKEGLATQKAASYYHQDKRKGRDLGQFNITKDYIIEHIFSSKCIYCGESDWRKLGCDRIDDKKAHSQDNVVCSCYNCNIDRMYKKMTVDEYIGYKKHH